MVGGTVIEVAEIKGRIGVLFIDCADMPTGRAKPDFCATLIELDDVSSGIKFGDSLWWQGPHAMWTPKKNLLSAEERSKKGHRSGVEYDIKLKRVGYSGVKYPNRPQGGVRKST